MDGHSTHDSENEQQNYERQNHFTSPLAPQSELPIPTRPAQRENLQVRRQTSMPPPAMLPIVSAYRVNTTRAAIVNQHERLDVRIDAAPNTPNADCGATAPVRRVESATSNAATR
jgi:hypothetical protein